MGAGNFRNTVEKVFPFYIKGNRLSESKRLTEKCLPGTWQSLVGFGLSSLNSEPLCSSAFLMMKTLVNGV